jgi:hypothetical protein
MWALINTHAIPSSVVVALLPEELCRDRTAPDNESAKAGSYEPHLSSERHSRHNLHLRIYED